MLRPIDTQTIYQQSPELSNREYMQKHGEAVQQNQFAQIMQKETHIKQEVVVEAQKDEKINHQPEKNKKKQNQGQGERKKKDAQKHKEDQGLHQGGEGHFDIRI